MYLRIISLLLLVLVTILSCTKPPTYPDSPIISEPSFNQQEIEQGNTVEKADTLELFFAFTDGDGNLGSEGDSLDVYLTDSRTGFVNLFKLPFVPELGSGNGISGVVTVRMSNTPANICCIHPVSLQDCQPFPDYPMDTVSYTIQIRDRDGNFSNKIQSETISIICN